MILLVRMANGFQSNGTYGQVGQTTMTWITYPNLLRQVFKYLPNYLLQYVHRFHNNYLPIWIFKYNRQVGTYLSTILITQLSHFKLAIMVGGWVGQYFIFRLRWQAVRWSIYSLLNKVPIKIYFNYHNTYFINLLIYNVKCQIKNLTKVNNL